MGLRHKIIFWIMIITLAVTTVTVFGIFFYTRSTFLDSNKKIIDATVRSLGHQVEHVFSDIKSDAVVVAKSELVEELLQGNEATRAAVLDDLSALNKENNYAIVYILDAAGTAIISTDPSLEGNDYSFRNYFIAAKDNNPRVFTNFGITTKKLGFYFAQPIHGESGDFLGALVIKIDPELLISNFSWMSFDDHKKFMLADANGVVVASSVKARELRSLGPLNERQKKAIDDCRCYEGLTIDSLQYGVVQDTLDNMTQYSLITIQDDDDAQVELLGVYKLVDDDLFLILEQDSANIYSDAINIALLLSLAIFLAGLSVALMISLALYRLLRPIVELGAASKKVSRGDYDIRLDPGKNTGEVRQMIEAFNEMVKTIHESRDLIAKQVRDQTQELTRRAGEIGEQRMAILNILSDVSEEKKLSDQLAGDLLKFKLAVENASDHIVITDVDGTVVYANRAVERITGYKLDEVVKKKAGLLWHVPMPSEYYEKLWRTIKTEKKVFEGEITNVRKGGEKYQAMISIAPVLDSIGNTLYFVGIERDISEQKAAEDQIRKVLNDLEEKSQKLAQGKAQSEALFASIGDGIVATDQDGKITIVNKQAVDMLGLTMSDMLNKPVMDVLKMVNQNGEEVKPQSRPMVVALSSGEKAGNIPGETYYYLRADGTKFPVGLTVTPFISEGKIVGTIEVFRDITLEKSIDQAKTEFVSLASHQLRTPLTAIKLFVEMIQNQEVGKLNKEQKEYINNVRQSTERMIHLVNDLLNVSRLETGRLKISPEPTDMVGLFDDVIAELDNWLKAKNCQVVFKKPKPSLPKLMLDPTLMRQVISNLISNAGRYARAKDGHINIAVERSDQEGYLVTVSDDGIGIPISVQPKIFGKFFRADNAIRQETEGSGLGLYVVKMIVETYGGKIWFKSTEGKGATFYFTIPLSGMKSKEGAKGLA